MTILPIIGLLGGACFAYCGVPAAWATWKAGRSVGTPVAVAWMIAAGGVLMYTYLTALHGFDAILTVNYTVEVLSWLVVVWFHYRPRKQKPTPAYTGEEYFYAIEAVDDKKVAP